MRIKSLLCAAGIAALAVPAMAQTPVYSLNVVGYINVPLTNSSTFTLVANQLDLDGTMTNNTLQSVFGSQLPPNTAVYGYSGGYKILTWTGTGWSGSAANSNVVVKSLAPGKGVFLGLPPATSTNITLVGTVVQGTNTLPMTAGYQIMSYIAPISTAMTNMTGLAPQGVDAVYLYRNGYKIVSWNGTKWTGTFAPPTPNVGEGFFYYNSGTTNNWTQAFKVQ